MREISGPENSIHVKFVRPDEVFQSSSICQEWDDLARSSRNLYAFYQSPAWWEYSNDALLDDFILHFQKGSEPTLAEITGKCGVLDGISGVIESTYSLDFRLKTGTLSGLNIPVVRMMGGEPLIRNNDLQNVEFVSSIFHAFPRCVAIHIPWVPVNSECWSRLHTSKQLKDYARVYLPCENLESHYSVEVSGTFSEYLSKFKKNARYHLRKSVETLNDYAEGRLRVVRIEQVKDVRMFLDEAATVSARSWQHTLGLQMDDSPDECRRYERLAEKGVLRCYLLMCGDTACAFIRGFQYGDVFYYSRTGFHEEYAGFSPGKVLFYLMLEDLHTYRSPVRLNFQEGDYEYKRRFANNCVEKTDILLVRNDLDLYWLMVFSLHSGFVHGKLLTKRLLHVVSVLAGRCFNVATTLSS